MSIQPKTILSAYWARMYSKEILKANDLEHFLQFGYKEEGILIIKEQ